jgi:hypothetical protein
MNLLGIKSEFMKQNYNCQEILGYRDQKLFQMKAKINLYLLCVYALKNNNFRRSILQLNISRNSNSITLA